MKRELPDGIFTEVTRLASDGNALANAGDFLGAVWAGKIGVTAKAGSLSVERPVYQPSREQ